MARSARSTCGEDAEEDALGVARILLVLPQRVPVVAECVDV
jgi:hypothetical protein